MMEDLLINFRRGILHTPLLHINSLNSCFRIDNVFLWIYFFLFYFFPLLVLSLPSDRCRMLLGRNGKQLSPLLQAGDSWSVYLFLTQMSFHTFHHLCCPFLCFLPGCTSLSEMGRSGLQKIFKK